MMGTNNKFQEKALPLEAQAAPVFAICTLDFDQDGKKDLFLGGNISKARLKFGKYDANYGLILKGDGKGGFSSIPQKQAGLRLLGDVRSVLNLGGSLMVGINQQPIKAYKFQNKPRQYH
nr:hypothetical protein [Haliscomenobacter sp.]